MWSLHLSLFEFGVLGFLVDYFTVIACAFYFYLSAALSHPFDDITWYQYAALCDRVCCFIFNNLFF